MCNQLLISSRNMAAESNWEKIWIFQRRLTTQGSVPPLGSVLIVPAGSPMEVLKKVLNVNLLKKILTKVPAGSKIFSPTRITLHQSTKNDCRVPISLFVAKNKIAALFYINDGHGINDDWKRGV